MRIICPTCSSHYEVELDKIGAQGQLVRCARCRDVWLVRPPLAAEAVEAPAPAPAVRAVAPPVPAASEVVDFTAARRRLRPRAPAPGERSRTGSVLGLAAGAVILSALLSLYGLRDRIIEQLPGAQAAYAAVGLPAAGLEGLALRDVRSQLVAENGDTVLTLDGEIANTRDEVTAVPGITMVVRGDKQLPLYSWTAAPPRSSLKVGETVSFHARLVSPPAEGRDVRVSFAPGAVATTMAALP